MSYRDPSSSIADRVEDLLGQMTLVEKAFQLVGLMPVALMGPEGLDPTKVEQMLGQGLGQISAPGLLGYKAPPQMAALTNALQRFLVQETRLGIPAIAHNEALNGLVAPEAPNFPTAIGLAATWDPEGVEQMTDLIRQQMRAVGLHQALSPVMDVARDARWGRVHETYGEDPYLCSAMSVAFTRGLQGDDFRHGVIATGKHFLGYGLSEAGQNMAATQIGPRELYETFARPFEAAIREAGLGSIMNSYSEIDGIPVGSSREILTDLLRGVMGFQGFVVSDYMTIEWLEKRMGTATSAPIAGAQALAAGLDVELPMPYGYGPALVQAVQQGLVSMDLLDRSVRRVLEWKFRLGLFEQPYVDEGKVRAPFVDPENRALSKRLAAESMTLLKNDGGILPLTKGQGTIAVIGPHADTVMTYFPGYTFPGALAMFEAMAAAHSSGEDEAGMAGLTDEGSMMGPEVMGTVMAEMAPVMAAGGNELYVRQQYGSETVLDAVRRVAGEGAVVLHAPGCGVTEDVSGIEDAVQIAQQADVVILAVGGYCGWLGSGTEGEGRDTADIALPAVQRQLVEAVSATGTPAVMVLFQGRPYGLAKVVDLVPAILDVYYPGQEGGATIAGALFGDINPGGKLPVTLPRHSGQVPIYHYHKLGSGYRRTEADMHKGYTDMPSTPLFPFGHGLSYTTFAYSDLEISPSEVDTGAAVQISCTVTNSGAVAGDEVVQLYVRDREATVTRPVQELAGFKRVHLEAGETCRVTFTVQASQLGFYDREMRFVVEPGHIGVMIGSSSEDHRLVGEFALTGEVVEVLGKRAFVSKAEVTR
ncbi:MAG: glycoside hydrolase family 3 N-terminal domain-containing protein [Anaerolineae bacterium]